MLCSFLRSHVVRVPALFRGLAARATPNRHTSETDEGELRKAREWLRNVTAETIPHNIGELSFSRSSGPGGQNVNKINSKATLHVPIQKLLRHIPALFLPELKATRYYKVNSDALVIQSDDNRKQSDNARVSFIKLYHIIVEVGNKCVPGETSDAQKKKVEALAKASNEKRLSEKRAQSHKKTARKGGFSRFRSDDY